MTKQTQLRSIKQIVGRAIGRYNRDQHNDCCGRVESSGAGRFIVHTTVADGDGVSWARKPMDGYIWGALDRAGYSADFGSMQHCNGRVSMVFVKSIEGGGNR